MCSNSESLTPDVTLSVQQLRVFYHSTSRPVSHVSCSHALNFLYCKIAFLSSAVTTLNHRSCHAISPSNHLNVLPSHLASRISAGGTRAPNSACAFNVIGALISRIPRPCSSCSFVFVSSFSFSEWGKNADLATYVPPELRALELRGLRLLGTEDIHTHTHTHACLLFVSRSSLRRPWPL